MFYEKLAKEGSLMGFGKCWVRHLYSLGLYLKIFRGFVYDIVGVLSLFVYGFKVRFEEL
jgi:hypothetical protein